MERTIAIIKPGVLFRHNAQLALADIFDEFEVVNYKDIKLSTEQAETFYAEHRGRPFFDGLIGHMTSGPCIALVLEGDDIIARWRDRIGPTSPDAGDPDIHLRAEYGVEGADNAFHGSDSPEAFDREMEILFAPEQSPAAATPPSPTIRFQRLCAEAKLPTKGTAGAAGWDLYAVEDMTLVTGTVAKIGTGWNVAVPAGHELQIRARSGMGAKGIIVPNGPGTVDEDYRGELCVLLLNLRGTNYDIKAGDRIAQGVLAPVVRSAVAEVEELDSTERGTGGYGSTGR